MSSHSMTSSPAGAATPWRAARHVLGMLGVPGVLGLALLALAAWFWWGEVPPQRQALQDQQDQIELLRRQLQDGASASGQGAALPIEVQLQQAWASLWQGLPEQAPGALMQADVLAAAQRHGVAVGAVQFNGDKLKALGGVWRQRISLPVDARYPALRQWLLEVLRNPAISLDALDVSRADVMADQVKARVSLSLWWKLPSVPEASPQTLSKPASNLAPKEQP